MIKNFEALNEILTPFAGLTDENISSTLQYWRKRIIPKGNFYNKQNVVCKDLGIVTKGIFRVYYVDPSTDEEKNIFFFSEKQFIVSFRSFIYQSPCNYYIEALEDSEILYISFEDLQNLYRTYQPWERFGRVLAEYFFSQSQGRTEDLLFLSHEDRYVNLLKEHNGIVQRVQSYHLASYLGIKNPSLSRIRKRIDEKKLHDIKRSY